jgi:hypothetical protein
VVIPAAAHLAVLRKEKMNIGRNEPCSCGSGKKFKKCCAHKSPETPAGLKAGIRMKGGTSFDPVLNAYRAIVHTWDNVECLGEPKEWASHEVFDTEDQAMAFYKSNIRPGLEKLMREATQDHKGATMSLHRLEE